MTNSAVVWRETISRGAAIALMNNFTSVAEALKELVDNPIDYRWGQPLAVHIVHDRARDVLVIESDGGRGMGAEDILVWLNWGEGEQHDASHIGRWHQGGKAACGFLGRDLRLWAKRAGSDDVWLLEDDDWAGRRVAKDFGTPAPLALDEIPHSMRRIPTGRGHVRIELSRLVRERRWNLDNLRRNLASTYRHLIRSKELQITIDGEDVAPLEIPLVTTAKRVEISAAFSRGRRVTGWAGRIHREQLDTPLKSGLRLLYNGRLIRDGEWFGYNHEGKGALNSLVGELHMTGFNPLPNKTDFIDRGDEVWEELGADIIRQVGPLIAELRTAGDESRVSKRERECAQEVAHELEHVLATLNDTVNGNGGSVEGTDVTMVPGPGGRARPSNREDKRTHERVPREPLGSREPRTPPPADPVGSIARMLEKVTGGRKRPPLRIRSWDASERSAWTHEAGQTWLDVNKNYPLYRAIRGDKSYVAETAILELCKPNEGEAMNATDYVDRVNLMLLRWANVAEIGGEGVGA